MNANQYLIDFYSNYDEDSRLVQKHGTLYLKYHLSI